MEYFDKLEELKKTCPKLKIKSLSNQEFLVISFVGKDDEWYYPYNGHNLNRARATERTTNARVFVYDGCDARWYDVRRNTKGVYFNYNGKAAYLKLEKIPDSMI